jgi:hypothetical protein
MAPRDAYPNQQVTCAPAAVCTNNASKIETTVGMSRQEWSLLFENIASRKIDLIRSSKLTGNLSS